LIGVCFYPVASSAVVALTKFSR